MDMDPSAAASKALGETVNQEAAEDSERSERSTDETSRESSRESSSRSGLRSMLSSTEPDLSPQQASGALDFSTPWYAHLEVAFQKATNASGTPAWVHLAVAVLMLLVSEFDVEIPGGNESGGGDDLDDEPAEADGGVNSV